MTDFKHKIFIAGNHDFGFETHTEIAEEFKEKGIIYLFDNEVVIDGVKFYGSPWQPEFYDWAFNLPRGEKLAEKWSKIPDDTDILPSGLHAKSCKKCREYQKELRNKN